MRIEPKDVHQSLAKTLLVEGYPMVLDLEQSHGRWLRDALTGKEYPTSSPSTRRARSVSITRGCGSRSTSSGSCSRRA